MYIKYNSIKKNSPPTHPQQQTTPNGDVFIGLQILWEGGDNAGVGNAMLLHDITWLQESPVLATQLGGAHLSMTNSSAQSTSPV